MIELSTVDGIAHADLRGQFEDGLRWLMRRQAKSKNVEEDLDSVVDRVMVCIRSGRVRTPERLSAVVRAMALGKNGSLQGRGIDKRRPASQDIEAARAASEVLTRSERSALERYYSHGHSVRRLSLALHISEDHFRDIRRRFLAEFNSNLPKSPAAHVPLRSRGAVA